MVLTLTCVNVWRDSAETIVKIVSCLFVFFLSFYLFIDIFGHLFAYLLFL